MVPWAHVGGSTWEPVTLAWSRLQRSLGPGPVAPTALGWSPGSVQTHFPQVLLKADQTEGEAG